MALDTQQERELQARFDQLRADGQLCPCACENCPLQAVIGEEQPPRTHKDVARDMIDVVNALRPVPAGAERDALWAKWHGLVAESAAFVRAENEEFCRQHPEQCLP